jgi:hypothetical protein
VWVPRRETCCSGGPPTGSRARRDSPRVCGPSARSSGSLRAKLLGFFAEIASGVLGWIAGVIGGRRVEPRPGRDHQPGPDQAGRPRVAGADLAPVGRRDRVVGVLRHDHPAALLGDAVAVLAGVGLQDAYQSRHGLAPGRSRNVPYVGGHARCVARRCRRFPLQRVAICFAGCTLVAVAATGQPRCAFALSEVLSRRWPHPLRRWRSKRATRPS